MLNVRTKIKEWKFCVYWVSLHGIFALDYLNPIVGDAIATTRTQPHN